MIDTDDRAWLTLTVRRDDDGATWWCGYCRLGGPADTMDAAGRTGTQHMQLTHGIDPPTPDTVIAREDYDGEVDDNGEWLWVTHRVGPVYEPHIAAHVLWHFHQPGGQEPGDFTKHLLEAIARADPDNTARLVFGFAAYVGAFHLVSDDRDGVEVLTRIVTAAYQQPDDG
jgi:hypothetical protein